MIVSYNLINLYVYKGLYNITYMMQYTILDYIGSVFGLYNLII